MWSTTSNTIVLESGDLIYGSHLFYQWKPKPSHIKVELLANEFIERIVTPAFTFEVATLDHNCGILFLHNFQRCFNSENTDYAPLDNTIETLAWVAKVAKQSPYNYIMCGSLSTQWVTPILKEFGFKKLLAYKSLRTFNRCTIWRFNLTKDEKISNAK